MAEKTGIKTIPYYMILSKCSGMALDGMEESVRMFYPLNTPLQHWSFEDRGNGSVSIINRGIGRVLDVSMAGVENGTSVHLWQDVNSDNQIWILEPAGQDTYRIREKHSGRYLDIAGQSLTAGAHLNIWDTNSSDTQLWIIREVIAEPKPETVAADTAAEAPKRRRGRKPADAAEKEPIKKIGRKPRAKKPRGKKTVLSQEPEVAPIPEPEIVPVDSTTVPESTEME